MTITVKPFKVDLSASVPHMLDLVQRTKLPEKTVTMDEPKAGMELAKLKELQQKWMHEFNWDKIQDHINTFHHFTADIEGQTVHFIHEKSEDPNAIPVILTHGWPGTFAEYLKVAKPLASGSSKPSFNVVVPSLPGFGLSLAPPVTWTAQDTARIFDKLMIDALGYNTYTAGGGDWGSLITWNLMNNYSDHVRAVYISGIMPQCPPLLSQLEEDQTYSAQVAKLTEAQKEAFSLFDNYVGTGRGYYEENQTKPATIGLALYDNPIGQLAWLGEKYKGHTDDYILTTVSLYYLTQSFDSAAHMYYQNREMFHPKTSSSTPVRAKSFVPFGFVNWPRDIAYYPEFWMKDVGNLVYHVDHDKGGHFAAIDEPELFMGDLRAIFGKHYKA